MRANDDEVLEAVRSSMTLADAARKVELTPAGLRKRLDSIRRRTQRTAECIADAYKLRKGMGWTVREPTLEEWKKIVDATHGNA